MHGQAQAQGQKQPLTVDFFRIKTKIKTTLQLSSIIFSRDKVIISKIRHFTYFQFFG